MGRFFARAPEIVGITGQGLPEAPLPDAVHDDAGGQWVVLGGDPLRQLASSSLLFVGHGRTLFRATEEAEKPRFDLSPGRLDGATLEDVYLFVASASHAESNGISPLELVAKLLASLVVHLPLPLALGFLVELLYRPLRLGQGEDASDALACLEFLVAVLVGCDAGGVFEFLPR